MPLTGRLATKKDAPEWMSPYRILFEDEGNVTIRSAVRDRCPHPVISLSDAEFKDLFNLMPLDAEAYWDRFETIPQEKQEKPKKPSIPNF